MKEKILAALRTKYQGVADAVLNRIADKMSKTVLKEEDVATAVEGVTFQSILDSYGDSRATEAQQTAVVNYEKKHGLKDGQKVDGGDPGKKTEPVTNTQTSGEETPAWAKTLIETNQKLTEKVAAIEGEKITGSRKQKLDAILEKLPESLRKPYSRITLKDMTDEDFETLTGEIQTEVDALVTETNAKGAVFTPPKAGGKSSGGKEPSKEEAEAVVNGIM